MNGLKETIISLIFSLVAVGLCELLIPDNSFKNQIRLITGAVIIICMISPFVNGFEIKEFDFSSFENEYDIAGQAERSVAFAAKNEIEDILRENQIETAKITITTDKDENNSIIIDSVVIYFDEKDKSKESYLSNLIENKLGIETEVGE